MKLMSLTARRELLAGARKKYRGACWADKVKILDGFVAATDYERKYATRLLNSTETPVLPEKHPTAQKYDEQVRQALLSVWHAANQICSKRLVPFLPQLVTAMEHHGHLRLPDGVRVIDGLRVADELLPFIMQGLDTDCGSEFINYDVLDYCEDKHITFTRARTHRKNDQAHVEEKNGSVVRRLVGYDRFEGRKAWEALAQLYRVLRM